MYPEIHILGLRVETYPLMFITGAAAAAAVSLRLCTHFGLKRRCMLVLWFSALVSGFTGAALAYMLVTYTPSEIFQMLKSGQISTGLVFYGGLISGAAFTYLIARLLRLDISAYAGALIPALPLAHSIGRVGCFLSGCCYGSHLPVQLIESAVLLIIFALLLRMSLNGSRHITAAYVLMYTPARFLLEFLRGDEIRGFFLCFSTSQWISLILFSICIIYHFRHNTIRK